ncbi:MAG: mechanosensitive ion channel [Sphingomonadaceae bacterium]|nr:mechanosensitive ion channel [Sphingomonadaceae bacterium]
MRELTALLTRLGVPLPANLDWLAVGAGLAAVVLAWSVGWLAARLSGQHLVALWERLAGPQRAELGSRLLKIVRYGTAALLLAIMHFAADWWDYTDLIIGVAGGVAAAMMVWHICRAVHFGRWLAGALAAIAFLLVFARALGGLQRISVVLDRVGFTAGETRISLLTVTSVALTALALFAAYRIIRRILGHVIQNARGFDPTQRLLFEKVAGVALVVAIFFIGIDIVGIDLTALAFFGGAFGLAIGFGMQKTIGNLIAGIILLWDRSIKPGDVIEVGQSFGWVNKIGVRAVSIITRDGKEHLIPNEILMTEEVVNWSYSSRDVRVHIEVGVGYDCDIRQAQTLMREAAEESPRVLETPKPLVWIKEFGESAVVFDIRCWILDPEGGVGNMKSDVLMRVWDKFKEAGIGMPYPQRDIHVKHWPGPPPAAEAEAEK